MSVNPSGLCQKYGATFHDHKILIQSGVHSGYFALAERVIKRGVDRLRRNPHTCGGMTVVDERRLQPAVLLIGIHIGEPVSFFISLKTVVPIWFRSSRLSLWIVYWNSALRSPGRRS